MTQMTAKQQVQLVQRILRNACSFDQGKQGPTQGISKAQLAKLLGVTTAAVNNWVKGNNAINAKNLTYLQKLDKLTSAYQTGNTLRHKVLNKSVARKVVKHGISKFNDVKYMFLTTGQRHWTNAHAVTV